MAEAADNHRQTLLDEIRLAAARVLDRTAIVLLLFAAVAFCLMWWSAWRMNKVPETWWESGGNHGPWRLVYERWGFRGLRNLRWFWQRIFESLAASSAVGLLSLLARPTWKRALLPLVSLGLGALFFTTHYWLVD